MSEKKFKMKNQNEQKKYQLNFVDKEVNPKFLSEKKYLKAKI